jgi:hypothetical protein
MFRNIIFVTAEGLIIFLKFYIIIIKIIITTTTYSMEVSPS